MNYGELKERLLEILGRPVMPLAQTMARGMLDRELRIIEMEKTAMIAATGGIISLPDDFIEPQSLQDESGCFYTPISPERMAVVSGEGGKPNFALGNGYMVLSTKPVDGSMFKLVYFSKLDQLSESTDESAALTAAPEAFVYSLLLHHAKLIRDAGAVQTWEGEAMRSIAAANMAATKARFNGGTLEVTPPGTTA